MKRRKFISLLGAVALGWPIIAPAQQMPAEMGGEKAAVTLGAWRRSTSDHPGDFMGKLGSGHRSL